MIVDAVFVNQQKWFPNQPYMKKMSEIKNSIQSMITNSEINLYCPLNDTDIHGPNIYFENEIINLGLEHNTKLTVIGSFITKQNQSILIS